MLDAERWLDKMTEAWLEAEAMEADGADATEAPTAPYLDVLASRVRAMMHSLRQDRRSAQRVAGELDQLHRSIVHNIDARTWRIDANAPDVGNQVRARRELREARGLLADAGRQLRSTGGAARVGSAGVLLHRALGAIGRARHAWPGPAR